MSFFKTSSELRYYHEITNDVVGLTRLQGGYVTPWGGRPLPVPLGKATSDVTRPFRFSAGAF